MGELFIHNLGEYFTKYDCHTFIETGTGKGTGLNYAVEYPFEKIYSIEYMESLYEECKKTFADDDRIILLNSDSASGLEEILNFIPEDKNILFWLDAHFPGADFGLNSYDHLSDVPDLHKPLNEELRLISNKRPSNKDVFIIDDLQLYEDGPFEIPYAYGFKDKYGESGIDFIEDLFGQTHYFRRYYRHQGSLILTPGDEK